jgi:hypothetical protein
MVRIPLYVRTNINGKRSYKLADLKHEEQGTYVLRHDIKSCSVLTPAVAGHRRGACPPRRALVCKTFVTGEWWLMRRSVEKKACGTVVATIPQASGARGNLSPGGRLFAPYPLHPSWPTETHESRHPDPYLAQAVSGVRRPTMRFPR